MGIYFITKKFKVLRGYLPLRSLLEIIFIKDGVIKPLEINLSMTSHNIFFDSAQTMHDVEDKSVDLVVTSPPYPMIEIWDEILGIQNSKISSAFNEKDYKQVYKLMHKELEESLVSI